MLDNADAARLNAALTNLAALIDTGADPTEVIHLARDVIEGFADDGSPAAHAHKLVRLGWEQTWSDSGFLASAWFFDRNLGVLDQRSGRALFAVFLTMAQLLQAVSDQRRRTLIAEARGLLAEYLAIRGAAPQQ